MDSVTYRRVVGGCGGCGMGGSLGHSVGFHTHSLVFLFLVRHARLREEGVSFEVLDCAGGDRCGPASDQLLQHLLLQNLPPAQALL